MHDQKETSTYIDQAMFIQNSLARVIVCIFNHHTGRCFKYSRTCGSVAKTPRQLEFLSDL